MSSIRVEQTIAVSGSGSGPTLADLRDFLEYSSNWPADSRVKITHYAGDQRDGSSWRIELVRTS